MTVAQLIGVLEEFEGDLPTSVFEVNLQASEDGGYENYDDEGEVLDESGENEISWLVRVN